MVKSTHGIALSLLLAGVLCVRVSAADRTEPFRVADGYYPAPDAIGFAMDRVSTDDRQAALGSFVATLPFLAASRRCDTRRGRTGWLLLSVLPELARMDSSDTAPSSLAFGWGAAYAASGLFRSGAGTPKIGATFIGGSLGLFVRAQW